MLPFLQLLTTHFLSGLKPGAVRKRVMLLRAEARLLGFLLYIRGVKVHIYLLIFDFLVRVVQFVAEPFNSQVIFNMTYYKYNISYIKH